MDWFSPIFFLLAKTLIWENLILSIFNEIGWIRMLKCCLIDDWLDQFYEKVFGTIFPNLLVMAENMNPNSLGFLIFLFIGWLANHLGMLNLCLIWFNWIEFDLDMKSPPWPRHEKHVIMGLIFIKMYWTCDDEYKHD